mmetsp:Transcript_46385/g.91524  ORF Transcript_46385/g.91524 Transcript_46385/m.91524 type:complete len:537 (+) Transcript_46385:261-1871(+)
MGVRSSQLVALNPCPVPFEGLGDDLFKAQQQHSHQQQRQVRGDSGHSCPEFQACQEAIKKLGLMPCLDLYHSKCYCQRCCSMRGEHSGTVYARGEPAEKYRLPSGWVRFAVRLSMDELQKFGKWHVAFHGTTEQNVVGICRDRTLRVPDNKEIKIREGHIPDQFYFFTTPSVLYAAFGLYASPFKLDGSWWQVVVQVLQKPYSYEKMMETSGLASSNIVLDRFDNREVEWRSSRAKTTVAYGVLLRRIPNEEPQGPYPSGTFFKLNGQLWYQPFDGSPPFLPDQSHAGANGYASGVGSREPTQIAAPRPGAGTLPPRAIPSTATTSSRSNSMHVSRLTTSSGSAASPSPIPAAAAAAAAARGGATAGGPSVSRAPVSPPICRPAGSPPPSAASSPLAVVAPAPTDVASASSSHSLSFLEEACCVLHRAAAPLPTRTITAHTHASSQSHAAASTAPSATQQYAPPAPYARSALCIKQGQPAGATAAYGQVQAVPPVMPHPFPAGGALALQPERVTDVQLGGHPIRLLTTQRTTATIL